MIEQLFEQLGDNFYELKRMVSGGFCAYSLNEKATGATVEEALQNLLNAVEKGQ